MMTILHLRGVEKTVELAAMWSGTSLVDHDGRLWRVVDAVEVPSENRMDVYAIPLESYAEEYKRQEFANYGTKHAEPGPPAEKTLFAEKD